MKNSIRIISIGLIICTSIVLIAANGCPWNQNTDEATIAGSSFPLASAVSALSATAISSTQINLSWQNNSNNTLGFKIERKTGVNGTYTEIATVGSISTTYSDTDITSDITYYYRVRAYNANGYSMYTNEVGATTPGLFLEIMFYDSPSRYVILSWNDPYSDETGFEIERSVDGGSYQQFTTVGVNIVSWSDTDLTSYTSYYYRIRANTALGNGSYSNEVGVVLVK